MFFVQIVYNIVTTIHFIFSSLHIDGFVPIVVISSRSCQHKGTLSEGRKPLWRKFPSDNFVSLKQCSSKPIPLKQHCSQEGNQKDLIGKQVL